MKLSERDKEFLTMLKFGKHHIPQVWNEELRHAISNGWVTVGWGGIRELTDAGRAALNERERG
jgi:hypothetical protein